MLLDVDVLDVNNNHPQIISSDEVVTFADPGRIIHYVVATDDDDGKNATISYEIIADTSNSFGIDQKTARKLRGVQNLESQQFTVCFILFSDA
ncbi:unnamed protein product [Cylicostephanus goldi]|uniref:Cadherin domain-containing protein n=1 Tax=Cylicostephanus goldi TaxID=71465 RepID=A0A3P6SIS3_CYLGO|nr:unnamed protein product [Cylicostephanus goldi]